MTKPETEIYEPNTAPFERYIKATRALQKGGQLATAKSHEDMEVPELKRLLLKADRTLKNDSFGRHDKTLVSVSVPTKHKRIESEVLERLYDHFGVSRSNVAIPGVGIDTAYDGKTKKDRLEIAGNRIEKDGTSWEWDHSGELTRVETQTNRGISIVEEWRKVPKGGLPTGDTLPVDSDRTEHVISFRRQPMEAIGSLAVQGPMADPHDY